MTPRREAILAMLEQEPNDPFLKYSLAMDYRKDDMHDESLRILTELTQLQPKYVAAFFMAAQQLVELERLDEARSFLREGIEEARLQNNLHAAAEMSELLAQIGK